MQTLQDKIEMQGLVTAGAVSNAFKLQVIGYDYQSQAQFSKIDVGQLQHDVHVWAANAALYIMSVEAI